MRSPRAIAAELAELADELESIAARQEDLWARRLEVWVEGRQQVDGRPLMKQHELAAPSRVTEGAVTQALRKRNMRIENNGAWA